jgi:predicted HTH domain antitoxin
MSKVLNIQVEVPDAVSEQSVKVAEAVARQAVIIALQQRGELTIREAADALDLTYEEYLQLLAEEGLGLSRFEQDPSVLQRLRQSLPNRFPSHQ